MLPPVLLLLPVVVLKCKKPIKKSLVLLWEFALLAPCLHFEPPRLFLLLVEEPPSHSFRPSGAGRERRADVGLVLLLAVLGGGGGGGGAGAGGGGGDFVLDPPRDRFS